MTGRQDELRDELVAILGASRELSPDADRQLAEAFIHFLDQPVPTPAPHLTHVDQPHQPHYSLKIAGGMWGATFMFLFLLLLLSHLDPGAYILTAIIILTLVAVISRAFLFMARHGWRIPHIHVTVPPASGNTHRT